MLRGERVALAPARKTCPALPKQSRVLFACPVANQGSSGALARQVLRHGLPKANIQGSAER